MSSMRLQENVVRVYDFIEDFKCQLKNNNTNEQYQNQLTIVGTYLVIGFKSFSFIATMTLRNDIRKRKIVILVIHSSITD